MIMKKFVAICALVLFTGSIAFSATSAVSNAKSQYSVSVQEPKKKETKKTTETKPEATKEKSCETSTTSGCCKSSCEDKKK